MSPNQKQINAERKEGSDWIGDDSNKIHTVM